jgi:hypothetical protein
MPKVSKLASGASFFIAIALVACSWFLGGTKLEWIIVPFVAPGMFLAAVVFPEGPHSDHAMIWFVLAGILNLIMTWVALLILFTFVENFILRKREQE